MYVTAIISIRNMSILGSAHVEIKKGVCVRGGGLDLKSDLHEITALKKFFEYSLNAWEHRRLYLLTPFPNDSQVKI